MSLEDDITRYYAERADVYDETAGYFNEEAEQLRAPIKDRYRQMFRGKDVLEIACGSGYWTEVLGRVAKSVLAFDITEEIISRAVERCRTLPNVRFQIADAYTLGGVPGGFGAAVAIWWWSHVPKEKIRQFLTALHTKLAPGALVMFVDQLPYEGFIRTTDDGGNTLEVRELPDGRTFSIVKNFPAEQEIRDALADFAGDIRYTERPAEGNWEVVYTSLSQPGGD
ncbi:MAG: class I SAM-dependent methyltransferase [Dehalococcoidales bacterium]|nr:class I SAM-dependent methyltransferase [Dehalococcoidales bacterium]